MNRRLLLLAIVVLAAVAVPVASADTTYRVAGSASQVITTLSGVCPFSVQVSSNYSYVVNLRYDQNGLLYGQQQIIEQDTFTANGKTLVGDPYRFNSIYTVDLSNFGIVSEYTSGQVESVVLPNGSVFYSAGRVNLTPDPSRFSITPDTGLSGNVAGFCAALT